MSYQKIDIGNVHITGTDRTADYRWIFPSPPVNKIILDIGCHIGFYILQAATEGAIECIGIDTNINCIQKGKAVSKKLGLDDTIIYQHTDAEKVLLVKSVDITLCINLLHHLETIDRVKKLLNKIDDATLEEMYFSITPKVKNDKVLYEGNYYTEVTNYNKIKKVRIEPSFFAYYWPKYTIKYSSSFVDKNRTLVGVFK